MRVECRQIFSRASPKRIIWPGSALRSCQMFKCKLLYIVQQGTLRPLSKVARMLPSTHVRRRLDKSGSGL